MKIDIDKQKTAILFISKWFPREIIKIFASYALKGTEVTEDVKLQYTLPERTSFWL